MSRTEIKQSHQTDFYRIGRPSIVARGLGVDHRTLASAVKRGYVATIPIFGGDCLIDVDSARAWLRNEEQRKPGPKSRNPRPAD